MVRDVRDREDSQAVSYDLHDDGERYLPWTGDQLNGHEHVHRYLLACRFAPGRRVLDIACGEGYGTAMLGNVAREVVGADIDEATLEHARMHHAAPNVSFIRADAERLSLEPERFDLVVCYETIEHIEAHEAFLKQVRHALTPAGVLIISTPNRRTYTDEADYHNPFHKRELYKEEFTQLLQQSFQHVRLLGQQLIAGSYISYADGSDECAAFVRDKAPCELSLTAFDASTLEYSETQRGVIEPRYFTAICSNDPVPPLPATLMLDAANPLREHIEQAYAEVKDREEREQQAWAQVKEQEQQAEYAWAQVRDREKREQDAWAHVKQREEALEALRQQMIEQEQDAHRQHDADESIIKHDEEALEALRQQEDEHNQQMRVLQHYADEGALVRAQLEAIEASKAYKLITRVIWPTMRLVRGTGAKGALREFVRRGRAKRASVSATTDASDALQAGIDTDLTRPLVVGPGQVLKVGGWCYHPRQRIRALSVLVDGVAHPVKMRDIVKHDVFRAHAPAIDRQGHSLNSGFYVLVPFARVDEPRDAHLTLRATLADGSRREVELGSMRVLPYEPQPQELTFPDMAADPAEPRVTICMATYNPPLDLLEQQVDSLIAQSHQNWICIVNDDGSKPAIYAGMKRILERDARFHLFRNATRQNFYHNFEAALALVPAATQFVALCDQDDVWYPEKLRASLAAFTPQTMLVYTDLDVVTRAGKLVHHSYWVGRRNNYTDFKSLLFANTVTGAASVFRAELLRDVLPFPERVGDSFHDHWIACMALTRGALGYVDKPMYAYRQHGENVLGHFTGRLSRIDLTGLLRTFTSARRLKGAAATTLWHSREVLFNDVLRIALIAKTIRLRSRTMPHERRRVLDEFATFDRSLANLLRESAASVLERRPTLGAEWYCARGALANRLLNTYYRRKSQAIYKHHVAAQAAAVGDPVAAAPAAASTGDGKQSVRAESLGNVEIVLEKIAPLRLKIGDRTEPRINLIVPSIDFRYLFGGYIGKLNLALQLQKAGHTVRLVIVDWCDYHPSVWRQQIQGYQELADFFDKVEVAYHWDREKLLAVSPNDRFIATTWWTAHIAQRAVRELGQERFIYLIQEYEPMTFPMGSFHALASETYTFPHYALFSTELLRDYFKLHRIGVFAEGLEAGECNSISFQNAINTFEVNGAALRARTKRKLLFYARPEPHAARNMYEIGVCALQEAIRDGYFEPSEWELYGIGTVADAKTLKLAQGRELRLLPRLNLDEYVALLPSFDVGLSLMLTPHPSLVPLEMAAAGMWVITNTCENKSREALEALSSNFIVTAPTISGVTEGLKTAAQRVGEIEARVVGSQVHWSTDWDDALGGDVMRKLSEFVAQRQPAGIRASISMAR